MNKLGLLVAALFLSAVSFAQNTSEKEVKKTKKVVVKTATPPSSKELRLIQSNPGTVKTVPAGTKRNIKAVEPKKAGKK